MNTAKDLIKFVGKPEFVEEMVKLPVWEAVRPKPWKHDVKFYTYMEKNGSDTCKKCAKNVFSKDYFAEINNCLIPDSFIGSLAELAWELEKKVIAELGYDAWLTGVCAVVDARREVELCPTCNQTTKMKRRFDWGEEANEYHWIIAALLAIEMEMKKK